MNLYRRNFLIFTAKILHMCDGSGVLPAEYFSITLISSALHYRFHRKCFSPSMKVSRKVQFGTRNLQYFHRIGQAQQKHYLVYTSEYNGSSNIYTGIVEALGSDSFTLYVL